MSEDPIVKFEKAKSALKEIWRKFEAGAHLEGSAHFAIGDVAERCYPHLKLIEKLVEYVYPSDVAFTIKEKIQAIYDILNGLKEMSREHDEDFRDLLEEERESSTKDALRVFDEMDKREDEFLDDYNEKLEEFKEPYIDLLTELDGWKAASYAQPTSHTLDKILDLSITDLISKGETDSVEFKSSLIWDYKKRQPSKLMGVVAVRTVSSFMNSEGGILLLGVDDNKEVVGLDNDLAQMNGSKDKFQLHFISIVNNYLGKIYGPLIDLRFDEIENKDVAIIIVKKSSRPVYRKYEGRTEFFIRSGASCQSLNISEATEYIRGHWQA
jgi:hypothetical protein